MGIVLLMRLQGCATTVTEVSPMCISRVETKCQRPLDEPIDPVAADPIIRENALRVGECAEKVVKLLEDFKLCQTH